MKEFAMRYHVPVAGEGMFVSTAEHAVLNARGYESYAILDLPDATRLLKALRARKALQRTKVLAVTRNNSHYSMGGQDAFISNDMVTKKLGARFNYFRFP